MIEICDVTKRYGETLAVDHLSCEVRPGEVTGFLGPNGAGKSTTMRMIVGLDAPPAEGTGRRRDLPARRDARRHGHGGQGRLPDPRALSPWTGFAVLLAYVAALLAIGGLLLVRRDA